MKVVLCPLSTYVHRQKTEKSRIFLGPSKLQTPIAMLFSHPQFSVLPLSPRLPNPKQI